jgi:hypothetical protein
MPYNSLKTAPPPKSCETANKTGSHSHLLIEHHGIHLSMASSSTNTLA